MNDPAVPIDDLPFAQSGQRLKVWSFVGDGVDLFNTFHDNQLDADCEFIPNRTGDCSPAGSTSLLLEVDRAVALPDLPLVER